MVADSAHTSTTDCLWDVGPVRSCHSSWMESSTSNQTPPSRECFYSGITCTRNFCEFCTTSKLVQGTSASCARHLYPYPERLYVLYASATIPGVQVQHLYTLDFSLDCWSLRMLFFGIRVRLTLHCPISLLNLCMYDLSRRYW